jgi:DNA-directed RNA polymerase subunit RPC12/RpoP
MNSKKVKNITLLVANLLVFGVLFAGYHTAYEWAISAYGQITGTVDSLWKSIYLMVHQILSLEKPLLLGAMFSSAILSYDIILIARWIMSFRFTSERACRHCGHKLIRERRQPIDRIISRIIPVKRFRCVGCSREYLMTDRKKQQKAHPDTEPSRVYHSQ